MRIVVVLCFLLFGQAYAQELYESPVAQLDHADDGLGLAESLVGRGEFEGARKLAQRIVAKEPNNQRALMVLGKVAVATGELKAARHIADKLYELNSKEADHHTLIGMVNLLRGDVRNATLNFERALVLGRGNKSDSQLASYGNSLVLGLYQGGQKDTALERCLGFIEEFPKDGDLHLTCSRLYRERQDYRRALEVAEAGLKAEPEFYRLNASIALAQAALGNHEASEEAFQRLKRIDPGLAKDLRATIDGLRDDKAELQVEVQ